MRTKIFFTLLATVMGLSSCVEDEGSNVIKDINEIEISGLEENYFKVSGQETLTITPEITGTLSKTDESDLEYEWFLCKNDVTQEHTHEVISTERNLNYEVKAAPSNYILYFSVKDKSTGLKWEASTNFTIVSSFVRGFYLFGDTENENVGLDFVSMIEGREPFVVKDILNNDLELKGAKDFIFLGHYSELTASLWALTESGNYRVEYNSTLPKFNFIQERSNPKEFIFPSIPVSDPMVITNVLPHSFGKTNTDASRSYRVVMTENEIFFASITQGEAYGNPINRFSASAKELYKPSKYMFYKANSASVSYYLFYDETNHCFTRMNGATYSLTHTPKMTGGTSFYWDQTQYESVRDLVYGQNGYGNGGRSYALMKDTNGEYYVYSFTVSHYSPTAITQHFARPIDLNVATDFSQASHYAFYSMQQILLYASGSKLYAYDYYRNECKLIKDFGAEVTYLAMDYNSNNDTNHIIVATYNNTDKGVVYGYTIEDNQNAINVTPVEGEEWHTDLKVVKVEYRNSTF